MATVELTMPKMGESVMEGTVVSWLKKEGDTIDEDESILEVATDKVDTEIPSTTKGVIKKIIANEGDVVQVGKPICVIETSENSANSDNEKDEKEELAQEKTPSQNIIDENEKIKSIENQDSLSPNRNRFYSPLVKNIAKKENITPNELASIAGTGQKGRVTKQDILTYLHTRAPIHPVTEPKPVNLLDTLSTQDEIIKMDRMRRMIADRMVASKRIAPHVTSFVEADVTNMVKWKQKVKRHYLDYEGINLTYTPIMIEAIVKTLKDYPMVNVQVQGNQIIKKANINIGLAVALPSGNLIVPVIHNADKLSISGLAHKVNELTKKARQSKLSPDELQGGTYTVSNVGSFGNLMGTPIILQPQAAIMALGTIQKKPAVIETEKGDFIGIRNKMFISHSYDHRIIDGALGGMFAKRVADYLENFDVDRNF